MEKENRDRIDTKKLAEGVYLKRFPIVCTRGFTTESRTFVEGEISDHSWGRNIPEGWRRATEEDIIKYIYGKSHKRV